MMALNTLIIDIQKKFSDGCPNGFLLGWDINRFFQSLISLFVGFKVINDTDFNYSYCNSYEIELGENESDEIFILTLKVSFIVDAFVLHVTRYSSNRRSGKVIHFDECSEYAGEIKKAKIFLVGKGFVEMQNDDMESVVDGVHLELAEIPTVGKCLFEDFE